MCAQVTDSHRIPPRVDPWETGSRHNDRASIERAVRGDNAAFEVLVRQYYPSVWRLLFRMVRDERQAEGLAQEVFLAARAALPGFPEKSHFPAWLRQIAADRAMSFVKPPRARRHRDGEATSAQPESDQRRLESCFASLDGSLRATIVLHLEGLKHEEIASALGVATETVRSRLALARDSLVRCVARKGAVHGS